LGKRWRRVAGFSVVVSWPESPYSTGPPPTPPSSLRSRAAGLAGAALVLGGLSIAGYAAVTQIHAPQPPASAAGVTRASGHGPSLARSAPVSLDIPAIGVHSPLLHLGLNQDGSLQVPSVTTAAGLAAWYKGSVTPGQIGSSVIEGHVDSYQGAAVFFRLGELRPGATIDIRLANGVTAIFRVTGVREYAKDKFPAATIYGPTPNAALRLITCGGAFDGATGHYLGSTVVFASLSTSRRPAR
jgi:Sortase domain